MKSIWRLLSPLYRQRVGGLLLALLLSMVTLAAGVSLLGVSGWFLTGAALVGSWETFNLFAPSAMVRGFSFIRIISRYGERLLGHEVTLRLLADLRGMIFKRLLPLDARQLRKYRDGDLVARLTSDVDALDTVYLFAIAPIVTGLLIGCVLCIVLSAWLPAAALLLLLCLLLSTLLVSLCLARRAQHAGAQVQETVALMRDATVQAVQAHADLLALGVQEIARLEFAQQCMTLALAKRKQAEISAAGKAVVQLLSGISIVAVLYWGSGQIQQGEITGPVWAGLVLAVLGVFEVMGPIMRGASRLGSAVAASKRIEELIQAQADIVDSESTQDLAEVGDIVFSDIGYAYPLQVGKDRSDKDCSNINFPIYDGSSNDNPNNEAPNKGHPFKGRTILKGLSLELKAGERIAIIGKSGAGKSSLLNLLLRLDDPDEGAIYYAGVDIRQAPVVQVRQRIALLEQDAPVFLGTIRSNLLIGNSQASDGQLWQVLESARLAEFVRSLPEGLDTWMGETGRTLSAGQARRLCLARALLSPAQVLALDEPTQGLDRETELSFFKDLMQATQGRTVVIVTHTQLPENTVDRVYELRGGRLKELTLVN